SNFAWAGPDAIVFLATEDPTLYEKTLKDDKKDDSSVVDDEKHEPPSRLFRIDLESKKVTRLTENTNRILNFAISPDGKKLLTIHSRSLSYEYDNKLKPIVFFHDLEKKEKKQVFKDPKHNIGSMRWTPDGKDVYVTSQFTTSPRYVH